MVARGVFVPGAVGIVPDTVQVLHPANALVQQFGVAEAEPPGDAAPDPVGAHVPVADGMPEVHLEVVAKQVPFNPPLGVLPQRLHRAAVVDQVVGPDQWGGGFEVVEEPAVFPE